jgi:hypothetical protein
MSTLSLRKIKHDSSSVDNITLDSNGNVLIGTSTHHNFSGATTEVTINTSGTGINAGGAVTFGSGSGFLGYIGFQESAGTLGTYTSTPLLFTTSNTERVRIDAAGRVTTPYQPSFDVYKGSSAANNNAVIVYDNVRHNIGSHYSTSTGRFTAPISGRYLFCVINNMGIANQADTLIRINGSNVTGVEFDPATGGTAYWLGLSIPVIFNLNANDYVDVYVSGTPTYGVEGNPWNRFSGQLLG